MIARRLVVRGRVQGVGYRAWAVAFARDAGLGGWARNRPDGTVEIHAEGDRRAVEALIRACHDGPSPARVEDVAVTPAAPEGAEGFVQRPTG